MAFPLGSPRPWLFGLTSFLASRFILGKSSRFQIGHSDSRGAAAWLQLPLKTSLKYLGVQLQTTAVHNNMLGDERAEKVKAQLLRARALPNPETRRILIPAYLQGLYSEGVSLSKRATQRLSTVVCQAWWGHTPSQNMDAQQCFHSRAAGAVAQACPCCCPALRPFHWAQQALAVGASYCGEAVSTPSTLMQVLPC